MRRLSNTYLAIGIILFLAMIFSFGCSTTQPNLFSGKAVVQFDQAEFFVTYIKVSKAYVVYRYQMTELCLAKKIPAAVCESLTEADKQVQKVDDEIMTSLKNPTYPVDMAKVQAFIDLVMVTMMKVGVKGVTAGIVP